MTGAASGEGGTGEGGAEAGPVFRVVIAGGCTRSRRGCC